MTVEIVGGVWSGSIAILTDAAHQLSDVAGFILSFFAVWISNRKYQKTPGDKKTFG
jgi:zinc transporter 2